MNWYLQNGKDSDVVLSSRVRLSRNIAGIPFLTKCTQENLKKIYDLIKEKSTSFGYDLKFIDLNNLDEVTRKSLVEKRLINQEFANSKENYRAILINEDENICIEINDEDHIKIQTFSSGLELENLINLAIEIDKKLENIIPYSYHKQYGYLTACPTNVGTGLKASVLVHLPALAMTDSTRKVLNIVNNLGMSIRGNYGEGTKTDGNIYQISNNQTLGITEQEIVRNLNLITQKIIKQERVARKFLTTKPIDLEDELYRNYGILINSRKITEEEAIELLSKVKLGTDLGIIKELNDTKVSELILYTKNANLQKRLGQTLTVYDCNIERAKIIKQIINQD